MPIGRYDKFFGGERGAAAKALAAMKKTYGPAKGEQVFHATVIKRAHRQKRAKPRWLR
jgi:hypothetical protein